MSLNEANRDARALADAIANLMGDGSRPDPNEWRRMALMATVWTLSLNDIELMHLAQSAADYEKGFRAFAAGFPLSRVVTFEPGVVYEHFRRLARIPLALRYVVRDDLQSLLEGSYPYQHGP